jgi:hypothetical protein
MRISLSVRDIRPLLVESQMTPLYVSVRALVTGLFFYFMKETKTVDTHDVAMRG